jgi:uncharacterized membrane protein YcaP (DUF421 family)
MKAIDWTHMWCPERAPLETVIRAIVVYVFVLVAFRVAGRKELGRHATYDIVLLLFVSVAMRQTIVGQDTSLTTAMIGFAAMISLDAVVTRLVQSSAKAAAFIDGPVRVLLRHGQLDEAAMRKARVSPDQLLAAVRRRGGDSLEGVRRAYLERSGHISVVFDDAARGRTLRAGATRSRRRRRLFRTKWRSS